MPNKPNRTNFPINCFRSSHNWIVVIVLMVLVLAGQSCRQADMDGVVRIGLPDEPRTLNIWLASDANSRNILRQIYDPLYIRHPETLDFVPWLAAELPVYDNATKTYTIRLRSASWSDGRPLTAEDVVFTANTIKKFKTRGYSRWKSVTKIEARDPQTVVFHVKKPFATFLSRTLAVPIVPAHQWDPITQAASKHKKPGKTLRNHDIENPIGSGSFVLKQWRQGAYLYLEKNPRFFGTGKTIAGSTLGPHIQGLLFKIYATTDVAMLAIRRGDIDMFWQHIQPGYLAVLKQHEDIKTFASEKSALYYMGFNTRRPPFSDVQLRRATALLVDKDFIVDRLLQGQGTKMMSIIPPGNVQWYKPDLPRHGDGLPREVRIRAAYEILTQAGYTWKTPPIDKQGEVVVAEEIRMPDGKPMASFTILTPPADYDPARAISGIMIQEWLRAMGFPVTARPMEFGSLIQQVKTRRDFDAFILGYGRLSLDPDYLGSFFKSSNDKERGWNTSGYRNKKLDQLANVSRYEMDMDRRQAMIYDMQQMVISDVPWLPLYLPKLIEAVHTGRFKGWVPMLDGIGNRWSWTQLKPIS